MKKLVELLGQSPCDGDVGVEIECEGAGISPSNSPFWRTEKDGSLRGSFPSEAAEFVMSQPLHIDHVEIALDSLITEQKDAKFNFSFRTSVHVHVNVQQLTEAEMLAFLYLCLLVEEPLMNFCGETRKANRFCLRYADAEGFDRTLDTLFDRGWSAVRRLDGDKIRYAAINVHALQKYGSIEFRGMRGNMDKEVILPWCQTLIHLRDKAKELGSPIAVFNKYISMGNAEFITEALGRHADKFSYEDQQKDVERSFSLTIDLPHIFKGRKPVPEPEVIPLAPPKLKARAIPIGPKPANLNVYAEAMAQYDAWIAEGNAEVGQEDKLEVFIDIFKDVKRAYAARAAREAQELEQLEQLRKREELVRAIAGHAAMANEAFNIPEMARKAKRPPKVIVNPIVNWGVEADFNPELEA